LLFRAFRSGHGAKTSLARQLVPQTACEAMLCKNSQPVRHFCVKSANPHGCEVYFGKNGQNQTQSEHTLRHFWPLALKSAVRYARRLGSGLRGGPPGPTNKGRPVGLPHLFCLQNRLPTFRGGSVCHFAVSLFGALPGAETEPHVSFSNCPIDPPERDRWVTSRRHSGCRRGKNRLTHPFRFHPNSTHWPSM